MRVLNRLATIAAESDGVEKHVFVRRAQEALSVARVRCNGYVWKQGLQYPSLDLQRLRLRCAGPAFVGNRHVSDLACLALQAPAPATHWTS